MDDIEECVGKADMIFSIGHRLFEYYGVIKFLFDYDMEHFYKLCRYIQTIRHF